jgi:hypothetical protein
LKRFIILGAARFWGRQGKVRSSSSRAFREESAMAPYIAIMTGLLLFAIVLAV